MNKKKPNISANIPLVHPKLFDRILASCSQESTANIIPNPEIKSHISFLIFISVSAFK
tara:strand:- start:464 stop:637 length:174 start_codon:yes stop_codon:yes gene_type:complete